MAAVPKDCVWGADNINVAALPAGLPVYCGYQNGPFENMPALRSRFPGAYLISVATRSPGNGARAVDAETGTLSFTQQGNFAAAASFLKTYQGSVKPIVYTMASWAADLEKYLAGQGIPRSAYYTWIAHYHGQHLCGPKSLGGCGYGASMADATQYATGYNDYSVFRGYVVGKTPDPRPAGITAMLGDSDGDNLNGPVHVIQRQLNKWAAWCGFAPLIVDGDYGGKTFAATCLFQQERRVGLKVDGIVGSETEKYLANPPGILRTIVGAAKPKQQTRPPVPSGNPVLKRGSQGKQVAALQYYLRNSGIRGVRGIDADGDYETQTETAVRNLQAWAKFKPKDIDGEYGPKSAKVLAGIAAG